MRYIIHDKQYRFKSAFDTETGVSVLGYLLARGLTDVANAGTEEVHARRISKKRKVGTRLGAHSSPHFSKNE